MKKLAIALSVVLFLTAGCQMAGQETGQTPPPTETTVVETTAPDPTESEEEPEAPTDEETALSPLFSVIDELYEIKRPGIMLGNIEVDLTNKDFVHYYTGLTDTSLVKDVAVSEAMMSSQAYSLVLVQTTSAADAKTVAEQMLEGIDPIKWICVQADDLQVVAQGDLVMLFMVSSELSDEMTSADMVQAFEQVRGAKPDVALKK